MHLRQTGQRRAAAGHLACRKRPSRYFGIASAQRALACNPILARSPDSVHRTASRTARPGPSSSFPPPPPAFENSALFHCACRSATTLSAMRRSSARISAKANSATATEFFPDSSKHRCRARCGRARRRSSTASERWGRNLCDLHLLVIIPADRFETRPAINVSIDRLASADFAYAGLDPATTVIS